MSAYSWWKIGGKADHFIEVTSQSQLQSVILDLQATCVSFCIIGQGTNLLFDDAKIKAVRRGVFYELRGCKSA